MQPVTVAWEFVDIRRAPGSAGRSRPVHQPSRVRIPAASLGGWLRTPFGGEHPPARVTPNGAGRRVASHPWSASSGPQAYEARFTLSPDHPRYDVARFKCHQRKPGLQERCNAAPVEGGPEDHSMPPNSLPSSASRVVRAPSLTLFLRFSHQPGLRPAKRNGCPIETDLGSAHGSGAAWRRHLPRDDLDSPLGPPLSGSSASSVSLLSRARTVLAGSPGSVTLLPRYPRRSGGRDGSRDGP